MGNSGAVLCLAIPLLAMILALYALLYDRHEIGRMLGGPWRRYRYQRYLRSERWRLLRKQVLRRAGWRCECCGRRGPLDVHHLTMSDSGGNCWAICRRCVGIVTMRRIERLGVATPRDPSRPPGAINVALHE